MRTMSSTRHAELVTIIFVCLLRQMLLYSLAPVSFKSCGKFTTISHVILTSTDYNDDKQQQQQQQQEAFCFVAFSFFNNTSLHHLPLVASRV